MLKSFLRRWLEIPNLTPNLTELASSSCDELHRIRAICTVAANDYNNTLKAILELRQKFDVLAEKMGVVIVGSLNGEEPKIISVRDDGMLGDAKSYLDAAQAADRFINIYLQCMQEQNKLFRQLEFSQKKTHANDC